MSSLAQYASLVLDDRDSYSELHPAVCQMLDRHESAIMDPFIAIAHQNIRSVDPRWRMLYIDASILKALARASMPGLHEDVARECIATLDHAIIIAGAARDDARRDYIVHDVIRQLQSAIPWQPPSSAIFTAGSTPPPCSLPTSRKSVCTLAALPSLLAPQQHWSRVPFVMRGWADDWPAMHQPHQWASLMYLFSVSGPARLVPVEVGDDYRSDDWFQKLISWEEFLSSLDSSADSAHHAHRTLYLAQHSLLNQFPQLREDIILPDIVYACLAPPDFPAYEAPSNPIVNAWLGPKGTISPAHTDPFFNCYGELACCLKQCLADFISHVLVQVVGCKTVWLAPPSVAPAMYPYQSSLSSADTSRNPAANTTSPHMSNTSRVDVFPATLDTAKTSQSAFPLFWDAVPDEAFCVTLSPGDLLFFPPGWWHSMRSEDVSFSVSMWF